MARWLRAEEDGKGLGTSLIFSALFQEEVKDWIIPGGDADPATGETDHLMREADMNKVWDIVRNRGVTLRDEETY